MALIVCPECGKEVSDKAETCIHCGYPIAKETEKVIQEEKQLKEKDWKERNQAALQLPEEESIPLFLELGAEGFLLGYINAGVSYRNQGNEKLAYECYIKVYNIDPQACDGLAAERLGYLHSATDSVFYDEEKALHYLKECGTMRSNRRLGQLYDPDYKSNGFEKYKNAEIALSYYKKLLSDKQAPYIGATYNDIGLIYSKHYSSDYDVVAACYYRLAMREGNNEIWKNNYEICIAQERKSGAIWERNIESIRSHEDIFPMIERVNNEINNKANQGPRCPTCGSTNINKIGTVERAASTYMWGFFSKKMGKQYKCLKCGYLW